MNEMFEWNVSFAFLEWMNSNVQIKVSLLEWVKLNVRMKSKPFGISKIKCTNDK